jgi:hypothetical protein
MQPQHQRQNCRIEAQLLAVTRRLQRHINLHTSAYAYVSIRQRIEAQLLTVTRRLQRHINPLCCYELNLCAATTKANLRYIARNAAHARHFNQEQRGRVYGACIRQHPSVTASMSSVPV